MQLISPPFNGDLFFGAGAAQFGLDLSDHAGVCSFCNFILGISLIVVRFLIKRAYLLYFCCFHGSFFGKLLH